jgi:two-component system, chemotaxis family, protein-glutamate methylesterase/glutaminase
MSTNAKILIVEDELTNALLLKRVLSKAGYTITLAHSGLDALKILEKEQYDVVLTDWMMPHFDGIELIRQMRAKFTQLPLIIMVTALVSEGARHYALESGADDYIAKPIDIAELLSRLQDGLARHHQKAPDKISTIVTRQLDVLPPFVAVAIGTSTGGPPTLIEVFKKVDPKINAAFFLVQHGPSWMLETFSQRLAKETGMNVHLASNGIIPEISNIYVAPGDKHLVINKEDYTITLHDGPKENFVRPAVDPLFRSIAEAYGNYGIGVILTGLGRDGAQGAAQIASVKGTVLIQDPDTAIAPSMPMTAKQLGITSRIVPLSEMGKTINETVFPIAAGLKMKNQDKK